ncbi:ATP-dependent zinc protease [Vibrio tapetis]|uniref:Retropepsin-like aspartic endopeptidase domain-containing protein n=2 Tax=Vibrio tapetis TaxID=52443 RepID=A0A2N8ZNA4_9VIBR|nr:ATP-dependent zinc protease [Vibrio tapetis]AIY26236.1 conserved lipoprotein [Vibrio tapetis]SON53346.1 conserved exported protein of unknown function [Vibrio tapetis subsp. tapetis]
MTPKQKLLVALMAGSLVACANTNTTTTDNKKPESQVEVAEPEVAPESKVEVDEPEVKPTPEVEKPKPVVKPKPALLTTADGKLILGEREWVYFPGLDKSFKSRVDTGATTSSISAVDLEAFERDGKDWVKFKIGHDDTLSEVLEVPVERWVRIKQASSEEFDRRPVVLGWVQIGELKEKTPFTLTDRSHLDHPVLLGRSFFNDVAVVDVSKEYVQPKVK